MIEICKANYVAKHRAVGVDARGIVLEVDSAQIAGAEFFAQRVCLRRGYFALDDDVGATAIQFFGEFLGGDLQLGIQKINGCMHIAKKGGVGHDGFHRNVVRENFVVRIQDDATFGVNDLLVNVCFRSEPGVFVVLDCLEINQAKRKDAEQADKTSAHQSATSSATWIHVAPKGSLR